MIIHVINTRVEQKSRKQQKSVQSNEDNDSKGWKKRRGHDQKVYRVMIMITPRVEQESRRQRCTEFPTLKVGQKSWRQKKSVGLQSDMPFHWKPWSE